MTGPDDKEPAEDPPLTSGQKRLIRLLAAQAAADWLAAEKPKPESDDAAADA